MEHSSRTIEPRMLKPAMILPEAGQGIQSLISGIYKAGSEDALPDEIWTRA